MLCTTAINTSNTIRTPRCERTERFFRILRCLGNLFRYVMKVEIPQMAARRVTPTLLGGQKLHETGGIINFSMGRLTSKPPSTSILIISCSVRLTQRKPTYVKIRWPSTIKRVSKLTYVPHGRPI